MAKTALLHIGTMKTGTTSIQQCLAQAEVDGSLAPFCYPLWRKMPHHNRLVMLYYPHHELVGNIRKEYPLDDRRFQRDRQEYRRFFFEKLMAANGAVISAETLCGYNASRVAKLRRDLESAGFREFHVVIYIRDPSDFYLSRTQQILKATGSDPSRCLSRSQEASGYADVQQQLVMDPASFIYDFRRALETWEQIFPGRLIVRLFPDGLHHDVVRDFASVVEERTGLSLPYFPVRSNRTLSAEGMQIMQDYRKTFWPDCLEMTTDALGLVRFLESSLESTPQTKPVLKREFASQIRANHSGDAELVYAHYGVDLGLRNLTPTAAVPHGRAYRIDEIVESVDPEIVRKLLFQIARSAFGRSPEIGRSPAGRSLLVRVAASCYHIIPAARRPDRLVERLRRLRQRFQPGRV